MTRNRDLTGESFGRLTVISLDEHRDRRGNRWWLCQCECGSLHLVRTSHLLSKGVRSCGCLAKDITRKLSWKHGLSATGEYRSWTSMMGRCRSPVNTEYFRYGGRGITVCERWLQFENFLADMGKKPTPSHSIDRIDSNGNYCKENCRWSTAQEQNNNRRDNVYLTFNGRSQTAGQWARELGISESTFRTRMSRGWTIERIIETPILNPLDNLRSRNGERLIR